MSPEPSHISDELIDAYDLTPVRWFGHWLFMIIMCSGFAVGGYWIWPWLEGLNNQIALKKATEFTGLMFDVNFGLGLLVALFVWIFLTGGLCLVFVRLVAMPYKGALSFGVLSDTETSAAKHWWQFKSTSEQDAEPQDAASFLNGLLRAKYQRIFKILLPVSIITAIITAREIHTFSVYTETDYYRSGFFSKEFKSWDQAISVELGCNQSDDGGSLVYKINFPDRSVRIEDGVAVGNGNWLDNLERIDLALEAGGAEFQRWKWLKRNPLHPKCLRGFYGELGPDDKHRLDDLLRVDQL